MPLLSMQKRRELGKKIKKKKEEKNNLWGGRGKRKALISGTGKTVCLLKKGREDGIPSLLVSFPFLSKEKGGGPIKN